MTDPLARTAVVVVNYGSSSLLERSLAPLASWRSRPRVVIVDNHSTAAEAERVGGLAGRYGFDAVLNPRNTGFGAGANMGAAAAVAAGAETIVILNPDAVVAESALAAVAARAQEHPWGLYSPRIVKGNGDIWFAGAVVDLDAGRTMSARRAAELGIPRTMPWISGACLVTSAALWAALEGFDEDYFLYWEDVDISVRAQRLGADLVVVDDAQAVHDEGGTQAAGATDRTVAWTRSEAYYYFNIRNRLAFAARNLSEDEVRRWNATAWRSAYQTLLIGGRRKFLRPAMPLRAAVRGVRDGRAFVAAAEGRRVGTGQAA